MKQTAGWLLLPFLTGALYLAAFHPVGLFPLAWIAPVPLALYSLWDPRRWRRWLVTFAAGYATMAAAFFWVRYTIPPGPWLLAIYMGLYFPLFTFMLRVMVLGARLVKKKSSPAPPGQRLSDVGRRWTPRTAPSAHLK